MTEGIVCLAILMAASAFVHLVWNALRKALSAGEKNALFYGFMCGACFATIMVVTILALAREYATN